MSARVIVGRPRPVARVRGHSLHAVTVALRGATAAQYDAADLKARAHPWATRTDGGWEVRQVPDPEVEAVVGDADRDAVVAEATQLAETVRDALGPRSPGRPVADWRTLLPTLWTTLQGEAPAWVSARTRTLATGLLAALTKDVERAIEAAGSVAAAEAVLGIDRNLVSRWRRAKILKRE